MITFRKAKALTDEPDFRDEADQEYRLFKLVRRAWSPDAQPEVEVEHLLE